jgi:hypothetical protein
MTSLFGNFFVRQVSLVSKYVLSASHARYFMFAARYLESPVIHSEAAD